MRTIAVFLAVSISTGLCGRSLGQIIVEHRLDPGSFVDVTNNSSFVVFNGVNASGADLEQLARSHSACHTASKQGGAACRFQLRHVKKC